MDIKLPKAILIDARNIDEFEQQIINEISTCTLAGFDLETQDVKAHEGIKALRKENEEGDRTGDKMVFDWRAMVVTGMSLFPDNSENSYYFNLAHADEANRLPWPRVKKILDSKGESVCFVCHNAPFELTVMANSLDYKLKDVIDSMQMCVSAYGPDEYDINQFVPYGFRNMEGLLKEAATTFGKFAPVDSTEEDIDDGEKIQSKRLNRQQQELLNKVIVKESKSAWSYNGLIKDLSYGYGLKQAVRSFFGYQMTTFEEVLNGRRHMGELTGEETVEYGCDDAFWAVQLFYKVYGFMQEHCPDAISTFFEQENPMIYVYSDIRQDGLRVNKPAIETRRDMERKKFAQVLRDMKATIRDLLPFPTELDPKLAKYDKWYGGDPVKDKPAKGQEYRKRLEDWAKSADSEDDFKQVCQVSSPVSNAWAGSKNPGLSIGHYFQTRLLMYDLIRIPPIIYKGKVMSDGDCRGEVKDKINKVMQDNVDDETITEFYTKATKLIDLMTELSSIEQRMKLYLTPYLFLTDPETGRMYPEITSMLASRRMACSNPNGMQLAKRGQSTYVRGFYLADNDDEVLVSLDWSQIELVEIGEFSGDPGFAKAFGQLPYQDLHLGAAADVLSVVIPEVTEEMLKVLHTLEAKDVPPKLLIKPNGEALTPKNAKKYWRTEVGKGSNFNYWYSGALSTVGEKLGWTSDQMWAATEKYRERFPVAEKWRVDLIEKGRWEGFVQLPDGHRRYKWEATYEWQNVVKRMFAAYQDPGIARFGDEIVKATRTRAANQLVNSLIQGTCATLAKRSIIRILKAIQEQGLRVKFKMPIHDELLWSVHRDDVLAFIKLAKSIMTNHPDIIKNLKIDATASVGLTFEPFNEKMAPLGQIELDEAPAFLGFGDGIKMNDDQIKESLNYLFKAREAA